MSVKEKETKPLLENASNHGGSKRCRRRSSCRFEWAEGSWTRLYYLYSWWWMNSILRLGYRRTLTDDDLEELTDADKSSTLFNRLDKHDWKKQATWKILVRIFYRESLFSGLLLLPRMIGRIGKIVLLANILRYIDNQQTLSVLYIHTIAILICTLIETCFQRQYVFQVARIGLRIRNIIIMTVYRHLLSIHGSYLQTMTTAQVINILANGTSRLEYLHTNMHYLWQVPLEIIAVFAILSWIIGVIPTLVGYAVLLLLVPIQMIFDYQFHRYRLHLTHLTDQRVHMFYELIAGCEITKMYNWQKPMEERILKSRSKEFLEIERMGHLRALQMGILFVSISLISLGTFATMWFIDRPLNASDVFIILALFNQIRRPLLLYFLSCTKTLRESFVTAQQIDDLLRVEQITELSTSESYQAMLDENHQGKLDLKNASFSWNNENTVLSSLNISIESGSLVGIVGRVGSGKSSLLAAILGEMNLISGHLDTYCNVFSYAPQSPWILPDTIRANILLGNSFDQQRYSTVLHACCLDVDIGKFGRAGDLTMIGEKGVNLSGGQKARVALARAVYAKADIYLLDDPFSAVDRHVAEQIYQRCIGPQGLLKGKTRLLITHHTHFLSDADQIIQLINGHLVELPIDSDTVDLLENDTYNKDEVELADALEITPSEIDTNSIIIDEISSTAVDHSNIWFYLFTSSSFGWFGFAFAVILLITGEIFYDASNYWLSIWTEQSAAKQINHSFEIRVYFLLTLATLVFALLRAHYCFHLILQASNRLHNTMLHKLLHTSLRFFESNPSGRILNRASKDQYVVDEVLPVTLFDTIQSVLMVLGSIVLLVITHPQASLWLIVFIPLCYVLVKFYVPSNRALVQLGNASRSDLYTLFVSSLNGLSSIRAFKKKDYFFRQCMDQIETNTRASLATMAAYSWLSFWLEIICCFLLIISIMFPSVIHYQINPSNLSLSLTYIINISIWFQWVIRVAVECNNMIVSAERIDEYGHLPSEESDDDCQQSLHEPPSSWPEHGTIEFQHYSFRYRSTLERALNDINLQVASTEKLGIIGRTGAGKSSLLQGLFRLVERSLVDGVILIDGIDIHQLKLNCLRSHLSIIPQQPFLFTGTLRYNLDPFQQYTDEQCWMALEAVQLKQMAIDHSAGLDLPVAALGSNLSAGQCQLICVARAMLRQTKILLIDEATANIDHETDQLIQKIIRDRFHDRTVLTIAHRLNTLTNYDRLILLDHGRIIASGLPDEKVPTIRSTITREPERSYAARLRGQSSINQNRNDDLPSYASQMIRDHFHISLLGLLCFCPTGVFGVIRAMQAHEMKRPSSLIYWPKLAAIYGRHALRWAILSILIGTMLWTIIIIYHIVHKEHPIWNAYYQDCNEDSGCFF